MNDFQRKFAITFLNNAQRQSPDDREKHLLTRMVNFSADAVLMQSEAAETQYSDLALVMDCALTAHGSDYDPTFYLIDLISESCRDYVMVANAHRYLLAVVSDWMRLHMQENGKNTFGVGT